MQDKAYVIEEEELNIEKLEETINQIHESNTKLKDSDISLFKDEIDLLLKNFKKSNKKFERKMKSTILSLIVSFSMSIGLSIVTCKNHEDEIMYKTTEYTYVGDNVTEKETRGNNNTVLIKEYGYWDEEGTKRTNKIYDVSEYTFEDIKDYLNVDLTSLEYDTEEDTLKSKKVAQDITNEGDKIIIKSISEKDFSTLLLIYRILFCFIVSFGFSNSIAGISLLKERKALKNERYEQPYANNCYMFIGIYNNSLDKKTDCYNSSKKFSAFSSIGEEEIKDIDLETLKTYYEEMKEPLNEILNEIEKNNELRNEFVRLFNENTYLLNDPNLLMEKYNETLKEYDLLTDKKYVEETVPELKRILNEGGNNAR